MTTSEEDWNEQDSKDFIRYGEYFVPERAAQADVIASVIPAPPAGARILDLCCGQGRLSAALLEAFPEAEVVGLDISTTMLDTAGRELARYGDRFRTERFDLAAGDWRKRDEAPWAVVSSLAVHHLDGAGKQQLFADVHAMLRPGGALVLADLVEATGPLGHELARRMWDDAVREQSAAAGVGEAYEKFHELEWSHYHYPDPLDRPSPLGDQLNWLRDAGFTHVDAYWMKAGHAVFGGIKQEGPTA
ncbi:class I SAM-dependent methyltransferase [Streptomyces sp. C11-1]|uniref:Class I SAM-dependent methyltransferase n=1 Tax=Streptomyces durocortorensis TaxID=2811104 RepID=A0ABY9WCH3_9ACTN|nr:class I SAM-dependent methyltransferase [Streptomyces durocortorensis]WNF31051.1 class I SAM-dependent methyltransferase [Streptomyces durocortorensis]